MRFVSFDQFSTTKLVGTSRFFSLLLCVGLVVVPASHTRGQDQAVQTGRTSAVSSTTPRQLSPDVLPREAAELEIALGRIRLVPDRFRIVRRHDQFDWASHRPGWSTATSMQPLDASIHARGPTNRQA